MISILKKIFIFVVFFSSTLNAEENSNNNQDLYQVKVILISHNDLNFIEYDDSHISDKYNELNSVKIENNNCIINSENICIKYEDDYKLETFNDHKINLTKDKNIKVISHLEWLQDINNANYIKIKDGYDYSNEIFDNNLDVDDFDILGSGMITKYEGFLKISKNKFFTVNLKIYERIKMKSNNFFSSDKLIAKKYEILQKIKLNKTTYIDRDNFGLILKIVKINKS